MRWKYFLPTIVIIALITVFNILFLDAVIKRSLIAGSEMIFGAKVEIESLKTKFSSLSITIKGFKAANKNDVFKNLFEIDRVSFSARPLPLLSKKLIVNGMSLEGLKWGTARGTSGALPPKKQKKLAKQAEGSGKDGFFAKLTGRLIDKGKAEFSSLPALSEVKNAQDQFKGFNISKAVNTDDLESIKAMESMKQELNAKFERYQSEIGKFDAQSSIDAAAAAFKNIGEIRISGPQDAEALKSRMEEVARAKEGLEKSLNDIKTAGEQAQRDLGSQKELLDRINELKDKDLKAISEKYKLPVFNTEGIARSLFGPVWIGRVQQAIYYVQIARKYTSSSKKGAKKITVKREKGTDVSFPKYENPPDFLIAKMNLTGTTGGAGKAGTPLDFAGMISDITSDQSATGRPTVFTLNGAVSAKSLEVKGMFDHMGEIPVDSFNFKYSGLSAEEMGLPRSEYLPSFEGGSGAIAGRFAMKGEMIDAAMELKISGFGRAENDGASATDPIALDLWQGVDEISVSASITGTMDNLAVTFASNVDKLLSDRVNKLFGEKAAELKGKMQAEIDRLTNSKKAELTSMYEQRKAELTKQVAGKENELKGKIEELNRLKGSKEKEARDAVEGAKRQAEEALNAQKRQAEDKALEEQRKAKEAAEAEKKKAEEELKNKAQQQLKGLFGK